LNDKSFESASSGSNSLDLNIRKLGTMMIGQQSQNCSETGSQECLCERLSSPGSPESLDQNILFVDIN